MLRADGVAVVASTDGNAFDFFMINDIVGSGVAGFLGVSSISCERVMRTERGFRS